MEPEARAAVEGKKDGRVTSPPPLPCPSGKLREKNFSRLASNQKVFVINILHELLRPNRRRGREAAGKPENRPIARWDRSISAIILIISFDYFSLLLYGAELRVRKRAAGVVHAAGLDEVERIVI